jgi:tetratricopeptide (TPR) repeat protein
MADTTPGTTAADDDERVESLIAELDAADTEFERLRERVDEYGVDALDRVTGACEQVDRLFERYEDRATDYDDFKGYVEFQDTFVEFVAGLPEDLPARDAFEAADETFQRSRLKEKHFAQAREDLQPARDLAQLYEDWQDARQRYSDARYAVAQRLETVEKRIADLEQTLEWGEADLSAPVERLRDPIETYDDAVREAFTDLRRDAPARETLDVLAAAADEPLLDARRPPTRLLEYVHDHEVGEESVTKLLEYAGYSNSKLGHYVDDPAAFQRCVAANETYLDRLDAEPLTVGWPPPAATDLRWWADAAESVVRRFAPEDVVAALRAVRELTHDAEYDRLQTAAVARAELGERERERLRSGDVERDLAGAREARDLLATALEEHPPLEER